MEKQLTTVSDYKKIDEWFYRVVETVSGFSPDGKYIAVGVRKTPAGFDAILDLTQWGGTSRFLTIKETDSIEEVFKHLDMELEKISEKNALYIENSRYVPEPVVLPKETITETTETRKETTMPEAKPRNTTEVMLDAAQRAIGQTILKYLQKKIMDKVKKVLFKQFPAMEFADSELIDRIVGTVSVGVLHWALQNHADKIPGLKEEWRAPALYAAELAIHANMNENAELIMTYVLPLLMDLSEFGQALMAGDPAKVQSIIVGKEDEEMEAELREIERAEKQRKIAEFKAEKLKAL